MAERTIWKFESPLTADPWVQMPRGAEILHVQVIGGTLYVWALVTPGEPPDRFRFVVVGTGHPVPERAGRYRSTSVDGVFVWHVFEAVAS